MNPLFLWIWMYFVVGVMVSSYVGEVEGRYNLEDMTRGDELLFLCLLPIWPLVICFLVHKALTKPRYFQKYKPNTKVSSNIIISLWMPDVWVGPGQDAWWLTDTYWTLGMDDYAYGWFTVPFDGDLLFTGGRALSKCLGPLGCDCEYVRDGYCKHYEQEAANRHDLVHFNLIP